MGSPNRDGRTFQIVDAVLKAAARAGAEVELLRLGDYEVTACRDCELWECPAFERPRRKLQEAGDPFKSANASISLS